MAIEINEFKNMPSLETQGWILPSIPYSRNGIPCEIDFNHGILHSTVTWLSLEDTSIWLYRILTRKQYANWTNMLSCTVRQLELRSPNMTPKKSLME